MSYEHGGQKYSLTPNQIRCPSLCGSVQQSTECWAMGGINQVGAGLWEFGHMGFVDTTNTQKQEKFETVCSMWRSVLLVFLMISAEETGGEKAAAVPPTQQVKIAPKRKDFSSFKEEDWQKYISNLSPEDQETLVGWSLRSLSCHNSPCNCSWWTW